MEKIKHVLLVGIAMISFVVFGAVYNTRTDDVPKERVAYRALADSDEEEGDNDVEEDDVDEKDSEDDNDKDEAEKEFEKVKEFRREESKKESSGKNKGTGSLGAVSNENKRIKKEDSEDDNDVEDDERDEADDENEIGDDEMDDEDRKEIDNEEEGGRTVVLRDVITNEDGTITHRLTIIKKDGRKKVTEQIFDANNKLISKKKSEIRSDKGEEKTEIKTFDAFGERIGEYKMETKDGKKIEIERKGPSGESKLKFDVEKNELVVKVRDGEEDDAQSFLKMKADKNSTKIRLMRAGVIANSNFPITVDDETGKVYVKTPNKEVELKQMPDVIVEKAKQARDLDIVQDSILGDDSRPAYVLKGTKFQKFLGFYTVEIPSEVTYDANTGEKISVNVLGFKKMLSWFSF